VRGAMMAQNIFLAFSLLVILERFTFKLTNNRLAGKIWQPRKSLSFKQRK
jgi:hypothetical protein